MAQPWALVSSFIRTLIEITKTNSLSKKPIWPQSWNLNLASQDLSWTNQEPTQMDKNPFYYPGQARLYPFQLNGLLFGKSGALACGLKILE